MAFSLKFKSSPKTLTQSGESSHPRTADAPFNDQATGADIILRTSDEVIFYTHKLILSFASPFFQDMFRLPQPTGTAGQIAVVDISEDSRTLEFILRFCYPFPPPTFKTVSEIRCVLEAALKYDMAGVRAFAETSLNSVIDENPLDAFVIACRCDREDICRLAARRLLKYSMRTFQSEELRNLTAYQYNKLTQWHASCCLAAYGVVSGRYWFESCDILRRTSNCSKCWMQDPGLTQWYAPPPLWAYLGRARDALAYCPSSVTVASGNVLGSKDSWRTAQYCNYCGVSGTGDYSNAGRYFSELLAREVERVVLEVPIPDFCD
ncbi:hypothetical protein DENSPDRAFT_564728 [Dentipellis sp. KUC8613]|nr:hypothetical protein DENSPDRAFT_564728 [Dentipellis sp. KUC8613]